MISPETKFDSDRELVLLEQIERDPDITQASLAAQLGVAVGTVNWHIKRLVSKGYLKVKRAQRRKLRYIITPEGIAFRARLTVQYIDNSMRLYRRVRARVRELLNEVRKAGYSQVCIEGEGDIADICKLTCLELDIKVLEKPVLEKPVVHPYHPAVPVLEIHGAKVFLRLETQQDGEQ